MRTALLITDRVKLRTVAAKQFVRASARNALHDRLFAAAVTVALPKEFEAFVRITKFDLICPSLERQRAANFGD